MSSEMNVSEDRPEHSESKPNWRTKFQFPPGAVLLMFYQLFVGMGTYCFLLAMPMYMASMLHFSDTTTTTIYHAKAGIGMILYIMGAILADSYFGRFKSYFIIYPIGIILVLIIGGLSIINQKEGIIVNYFLVAITSGLVSPAIRAIVADQIPKDNKVMLGTYMHIIYLINNFGIIIIAYTYPIIHKDIYCFGMECYPLVFLIAFLLSSLAFLLFTIGFLKKMFMKYKPTNNLLLNILQCIYMAVKKRIENGKPPKGQSWFDYTSEKFDQGFIKDIKIAKGLLLFLLAHPLFWTIFEQMSSIWTLQAQYMDGMISENFVIKANQMVTLNPILVVLLIPIFEMIIYPCLNKIKIRVPYRIMTGQIFTALACVSMIFIQLKIDNIVNPTKSGSKELIFVNQANTNVSLSYGSESFYFVPLEIKHLFLRGKGDLNIKADQFEKNISTDGYENKIISNVIYQDGSSFNISSAESSKQINGGYSNVRVFNNLDLEFSFAIILKSKVGINIEFSLSSAKQTFGEYSKCGIGAFDVYFKDQTISFEKKLGEMNLNPAEAKTLVITGRNPDYQFTEVLESKLLLPTIIWQIIPYFLVTIGEILFNVNTGIFLYGEAPLSMKSMILAVEYTCIAMGNILILILKQILSQLSMVYLFLVCGILASLSGLFTGILGYFYLKNKMKQNYSNDITNSTIL